MLAGGPIGNKQHEQQEVVAELMGDSECSVVSVESSRL